MYSLKRVLRSSWFAVITTQVSVTVFVKTKREIFRIWTSSVKKEKIRALISGRGKEWIKDGPLRCGEGGNNGLTNIKHTVFM